MKSKFGFKFKRFLNIHDWKVFEVTQDAGWIERPNCPCDDGILKTVCAFFGNGGAQKVRVGVCSSCGYIGYIDQPTKKWIQDFYANTWEDTNSPKVKKLVYKIKHGKDQKQREILEIAQKLNLGKLRPVCEIGCGYGSALNQLRERGYSNLIGVENSKHRADFAKYFFKLRILTNPFEAEGVQKELLAIAPFSLIFSHHVFEHVYEPGELISLASSLQKEGDFFVVSLPNAEGEFTMSNLLYFPHLHSFRAESLKRLLAKHGYEVFDESLTTKDELHLVAKKTSNAVCPTSNVGQDYFEETLQKFVKGLALDKNYFFKRRKMWWYRDADIGGQAVFFAPRLRNRPIQTLLVEDVKNFYSSPKESPIEIHYDGNIKLTYK
ncbi:MAG: class I SAM-dependent methyltransferase [Patescibacteria group bacterium]